MVEYEFYTDTYMGGSIPPDMWTMMEARANDYLEQYKRLYEVTAPTENAESKAVCAMADALYYFTMAQNGQGGVISSSSVGSVSTSYATGNGIDLSEQAQEKSTYKAACRYLTIYRGVR